MRNKTILVTQHEAARELGVSVKTLRRWNCPKYAIGASPDGRCRKVRYNVEEVRTWLRQNRDVSHASDEAEDSDDDLLDTGCFSRSCTDPDVFKILRDNGWVVQLCIDTDVFKRLLLDGHLCIRDVTEIGATDDVTRWLERKGFIRCDDPQNRPPDHED